MKYILVLFYVCLCNGQSVDDVVNSVFSYSGGLENYKNARFLEFDWQVVKDGTVIKSRHHLWDKFTGDYVLSYNTKEGKNIEVYFNINSQKGDVYVGNEKEESTENYLKEAYASFINDTYWLVVPFKIKDEGVNLSLEKDGEHNVINMSFGDVGLTPGDTYKLFVSKEGKIVKWTFVLESGRKGEFVWENYNDVGMGLRFASEKNSKGISIHTKNVRFSETYSLSNFKKN